MLNSLKEICCYESDKIVSEPYFVTEKIGKGGGKYIDEHDPYDTSKEDKFTFILPDTDFYNTHFKIRYRAYFYDAKL